MGRRRYQDGGVRMNRDELERLVTLLGRCDVATHEPGWAVARCGGCGAWQVEYPTRGYEGDMAMPAALTMLDTHRSECFALDVLAGLAGGGQT